MARAICPYLSSAVMEPFIYERLTLTDFVRHQKASGDMNPIHHDPDFAQCAGYSQPFASECDKRVCSPPMSRMRLARRTSDQSRCSGGSRPG
jgi:hypothetical protein